MRTPGTVGLTRGPDPTSMIVGIRSGAVSLEVVVDDMMRLDPKDNPKASDLTSNPSLDSKWPNGLFLSSND